MRLKLLTLIMFSIIIQSCDLNDSIEKYEQKLVVFASITAGLPVLDTVLVSRTATIDEDILSDSLWVDGAIVELINDSTMEKLTFNNVGTGKYFPLSQTSTDEELTAWMNFIIQSGQTYQLSVIHEQDSIIAITTVPSILNLTSADLGDYQCSDGEVIPTKMVDVKNLEGYSIEQLSQLIDNPEDFVIQNNINVDSVEFRFGDCFTQSFASYPYFGVDFDSDNFQTIKILSYALESNVRGLEPLDTLSLTIDPDSGAFFDYNYNSIRDSAFVNLIYDTTLGFRIWKGNYLRDENNTPYRINPWQWNVEETPTQIMWLYFDYYGYHIMTFKATSESYFNYFSGDPVGQNIYILPDSNFGDGLGVFYSNYSSSFMIYVKRNS
ncbi:MAG: hypothetical protein CMG57_02830 [Candidatus Marinimicrobia bacterium]|nr:hypothetical protein [Candidatus Neomarinimicrobiota bacterium]